MNPQTHRLHFSLLAFALLAFLVGGCARPEANDPAPDLELAETVRLSFSEEVVAEEGGSDAEPEGTGWATLRGTFTFEGTPPTRRPLSVTKDREFCAPGGEVPLSQALLVDEATKGLANVAIYLRKPSRVHESAQPNDETLLYDQKKCVFLTHVFPIVVGQTMEIKNSDPGSHNTSIAETPFNQTIPKFASTTYKVVKRTSTPQKITCGIHPWMLGYYFAKDDGYMAITKPDGTFEIPNLPAGEELEFQVWHESANTANGFLELKTPEAKELGWTKKGRFTIQLEEGSTKDLKIVAPASAFKT